MRRLSALLMGILAGVVALRLIRRRQREPAVGATCDASTQGGGDRVSELRRKLDAVRECTDETVDPAAVVKESAEPVPGLVPDQEAETVNTEVAASEVNDLAGRRKRVHGRARDAAESMRNGDDTSAA